MLRKLAINWAASRFGTSDSICVKLQVVDGEAPPIQNEINPMLHEYHINLIKGPYTT
jgi:hypothetical protein